MQACLLTRPFALKCRGSLVNSAWRPPFSLGTLSATSSILETFAYTQIDTLSKLCTLALAAERRQLGLLPRANQPVYAVHVQLNACQFPRGLSSERRKEVGDRRRRRHNLWSEVMPPESWNYLSHHHSTRFLSTHAVYTLSATAPLSKHIALSLLDWGHGQLVHFFTAKRERVAKETSPSVALGTQGDYRNSRENTSTRAFL